MPTKPRRSLFRMLSQALLFVVSAASIALSAHSDETRKAPKPVNLRCEYLASPLAVDASRPRLSWELVDADEQARGVAQTAYQVQCFVLGPKGQRTLAWDSGKVASSQAAQIEYAGTPLRPRDRVEWTVEVWDNQDRASSRSATATWCVGLQNEQEWGGAKWIGDATPAPEKGVDPLPAPMLRREFAAAKPVARAILYATALGLYDLHLNGERVANQCLAPEWTDYHQRLQYQACDVTARVKAGANCVGVVLGDGWYAGKIGLSWIVPGGPPRAIYGRLPQFMARLVIEYQDGSSESIVTDESWRSSLEGPIRANDIYDGETFDDRRSMPGWDKPGFDAAAWTQARVYPPTTARVVAQPNEPIRVMRTLKPIGVTQPKPGVFVVDMGQNMVGWCRLTAKGKPGTTITLRHAEVLNPDGTIYTANLRRAAQTDRFIPGSADAFSYEPTFTYHGFRYVEVTGLDDVTVENIAGCVANSAAPEVSSFSCSEPMLEKLWANILWTQRANLVGVPTDCPQRDERCGWMGDILAFAPTACANMDMAAFFTKWVPDTRDAQAPDGRFPDFAPHPFDPAARFSGVPAWGDAGVFVPWVAYEWYGDTRILADQYPAAVRWIEYIRSKNPDLLWKHARGNDYGDWLNADTLKLQGWPAKGAEVPKHVFATAFFYRSTCIVSDMARVLGNADDAAKYAALADQIREAFIKSYVSPDGLMEGDTQAGYALALHFGLIPEPLIPKAVERMVARFEPYQGQISTGFHSTLPLMDQLTTRGRNDEAYRLILNRKMPSWGYEIDHGATTIWERWDGFVEGRGYQDPGMNSFAHYAIGAVGEWMFSTMVGIRPTSPGFGSVRIEAHPGPGVTWAAGTYQSIRGEIKCRWDATSQGLTVSVTIPPNMNAVVALPSNSIDAIVLDGQPLAKAVPNVPTSSPNGVTEVPVGSGRYNFLVRSGS